MKKGIWGTIASILVLSGTACERQQAPAAPPPPMVTVVRAIQRELTDWDEYPGRLAATDSVDVRARVSGFIEQAAFPEGAIVNPGALLFVIDVRPYQAELERAQAALVQAEAQQRFATSEFKRMEPLRQTGAVAETQFLNARQAMETANGAVAAAQAAVTSARLNVEWCRVTAPIGGRVSRRYVTVGNLITGGTAQATLLTTIVALDPIYCYADVDERTVRRYQQLVRETNRPSARDGKLPARLAIGDEQNFSHTGHIDFVDNIINPGTGTISIRGVFPNPDRTLLPGFYARLRIPGRMFYLATLVPQVAIGTTLAQQYVLTVDSQGVVQFRPVTLGTAQGTLQVVQGLQPTDRVIVNGLMNARPGAKVQVREVPAEVAQTQPSAEPAQPRGQAQGPSRSNKGPSDSGAETPGSGLPRSMGGGPGTGSQGGGRR